MWARAYAVPPGRVNSGYSSVQSMAKAHTAPRRSRAERQAETRARIVEAAVELHTTLGPARTSVSAIARRAGVQRHTVYAHYPEPEQLFRDCKGLWERRNPFPDLGAWSRIGDPRDRLAAALEQVYGYWEATADDLAAVLDGAERVPEMAEAQREWGELLARAAAELARGWRARGRRRARLLAALQHALALETWRSLVQRGGLRRAEAVALMCALVERASGRDGPGEPRARGRAS